MGEFVIDLTLREANTHNDLVRYVDYGPDFYIDLLALLVELVLRLLHFLLVSTDEQRGHVVAIWKLPFACLSLV